MSILNALTFDSRRVSAEGLKRLNLALAVLALLVAIAVVALGHSSRISTPLSADYLNSDTFASEFAGKNTLNSAVKTLAQVNIVYIMAATLAIHALGLLLCATRFKRLYEQDMKKGFNRARTYCQAPVMGLSMVLLGLLVGINDLALLIVMFSLGSFIAYLIFNHERVSASAKAKDQSSLRLLVLPILTVLLVLALYLVFSGLYGAALGYYVYAACAAVAVYLIAVWSKLSARKAVLKTKEYLFQERYFQMALSLLLISLSTAVILYARA